MITIKNIQTGETKNVYNTEFVNGFVVSNTGKNLGKRFVNSWAGILTESTNEEGSQVFTLSSEWEVSTKRAKAQRKPRTKKAEPQPAAEPVIENEPAAIEETVDTVEPAIEEPVVNDETEPVDDDNENDTCNEQALIAAIKNLRGGAVDAKKVRQIVAEELAKLAKEEPTKAAAIRKKIVKTTKEVFCKDFDDIVKDVAEGFNVYFFGRAGSGKSHTAEQVARALGLDFYGQTTIQFAHDVRGYGDAGGNFQDTPFFKAFCYGGVYFQDEYDRSNPEAAIVLNSALANGWYDFPIVGRVTAHENFRFIAAGNTQMNGADEEYVTGQVMDASSRDRFATYYEIDYSHEVEMAITNNDAELVAFVEDVRRAIRETGILHVVSYRATKYMSARKDGNKENVLTRCTFKGLNVDEIRLIYGKLHNTSNVWACAMANVI